MRSVRGYARPTVYIVPTREILNLMRVRLDVLLAIPLDLKEIFEYAVRAWLICGDGSWIDRCTRAGVSSNYVDYVRQHLADDMFNGNIIIGTVALDACLLLCGEFEELLNRHGITDVSISPNNTFRWLGDDLALSLIT